MSSPAVKNTGSNFRSFLTYVGLGFPAVAGAFDIATKFFKHSKIPPLPDKFSSFTLLFTSIAAVGMHRYHVMRIQEKDRRIADIEQKHLSVPASRPSFEREKVIEIVRLCYEVTQAMNKTKEDYQTLIAENPEKYFSKLANSLSKFQQLLSNLKADTDELKKQAGDIALIIQTNYKILATASEDPNQAIPNIEDIQNDLQTYLDHQKPLLEQYNKAISDLQTNLKSSSPNQENITRAMASLKSISQKSTPVKTPQPLQLSSAPSTPLTKTDLLKQQ